MILSAALACFNGSIVICVLELLRIVIYAQTLCAQMPLPIKNAKR